MSKHHNMSAKRRAQFMRVLYGIQAGRCAFCGVTMIDPDVARSERPPGSTTPRPNDPTVEHVAARSQSGSNAITNLVLAHERCNTARADGPLPEAARQVWRANLIALAVLRGERPAPVVCGDCNSPHGCESRGRCELHQTEAA